MKPSRVTLFLWLPCFCATEGVWRFEKISRYDRTAEPVVTAIPLAKGEFREGMGLALGNATRAYPAQTRVTSRWPDGSARWLLVRALVDLPGNAARQVPWRIVQRQPASGPAVRVSKAPDGSLEVDTGARRWSVSSSGFRLFAPLSAFIIRSEGRAWSTRDAGPVKLEIIEEGPVASQVLVSGRHGGAECPFDFSALLTFWAGKSYASVDYRILLARGGAEVTVDSWDYEVTLKGVNPKLRLTGGARTRESTQTLSYAFGPQDFRFESNEHALQSFWGDFWCDWTGPREGLAVTLRHAQQQFPKSMDASPAGLRISLGNSVRFPFGAAKSHEMLFHFHPLDAPAEQLGQRSLQFQIPDVPVLPPDIYQKAGVFDDRVFDGPRCRRIDALISDILDNRPVGVGLWNFGDEVDWGYTGQGRGRDEVVWLNNEYDFTHALFLFHARSGERRFLDYAAANARHWRDIDVAHVSSDPDRRGGHITHSARHVTGSVTPSHQWVEGLLDAWHFFGDRVAYDTALAIGDNILRLMDKPVYRDPGSASTRDMGWAMRAMLALWRETGETRYLEPCRRVAGFFRRWHAEYPGLLAPYTQHSMVRVNFMNALTLVSLSRYLRYFPDPELERMVLEETDELIAGGRNANGLFYYKELPSLKHQSSTVLPLQALAAAYELSRDRRYLEAGLPELEHVLLNMNMRLFLHTGAAEKFAAEAGGYSRVLVYPPGGKSAGVSLLPLLEFLNAARDTDLARQLDYQLKLH